MASLSSNAVTAAPASPAKSPGRGDAKFLLRLAWRNLSRHRRRTVITTIALGFSVAVLIFMDSMLGGIDQESQRNLVWYETGSGKVVTSAQLEDLDQVALKHELVDYVPITNALSELGIANTPRISFVGELFFGEGSLPIRFVGIDPDTDEEVFRLRDALLPGSSYVEAGIPGSFWAPGRPTTWDSRLVTSSRFGPAPGMERCRCWSWSWWASCSVPIRPSTGEWATCRSTSPNTTWTWRG